MVSLKSSEQLFTRFLILNNLVLPIYLFIREHVVLKVLMYFQVLILECQLFMKRNQRLLNPFGHMRLTSVDVQLALVLTYM